MFDVTVQQRSANERVGRRPGSNEEPRGTSRFSSQGCFLLMQKISASVCNDEGELA